MNAPDLAKLARDEHEFRESLRHKKRRLRGKYGKPSRQTRNKRPRPPRGDR